MRITGGKKRKGVRSLGCGLVCKVFTYCARSLRFDPQYHRLAQKSHRDLSASASQVLAFKLDVMDSFTGPSTKGDFRKLSHNVRVGLRMTDGVTISFNIREMILQLYFARILLCLFKRQFSILTGNFQLSHALPMLLLSMSISLATYFSAVIRLGP